MTVPFRIFIGGSELRGYTSATLSRKKEDMTGTLNVTLFFAYVPKSPVVVNAARGKEILVYVGGHLAFRGVLDKRSGKSTEGNVNGEVSGDFQTSIDANGYQVTLSARGKTKYLIDSSHQHPTTNMLKTTNRRAVQRLIENWGIELDWQADETDLPVVRFSDGGRVVDEVQKLATETCCFVYETRDGRLRITDRPGTEMGTDLILGQNILSFSADQSEDQANSEITVKGQRTDPKVWGKDAVVERVKTVTDNWVGAPIPLTIQLYGDATDEMLEKRGKFEADKRATESKRVTVEVFHVQQMGGAPWDIGLLHYVEVPPEGVFDVMECIELTYDVDAHGTLKTTLVLAPPPSGPIAGGVGNNVGGLLTKAMPTFLDAVARGAARRSQLGVTIEPGKYPASWGGADLVATIVDLFDVPAVINELLTKTNKEAPPLILPETR